MNFELKKLADIKKIQDFIKENNLEDINEVQSIMDIDTNDRFTAELNYYDKFKGKHWKSITDDEYTKNIQYMTVEDIKIFDYKDYKEIGVFVTYWTFNVEKDSWNIKVWYESNHCLSSHYVGRFDKYTEVSEDEWDMNIKKLYDTSKAFQKTVLEIK